MKTYKTSDIAALIGIHANTVRLYEDLGFVSKPKRLSNNYRVFTDYHIEQFMIARLALRIEILQNGLRKKAVNIIKASGKGNISEAERLANGYLIDIKAEQKNAGEAVEIVKQILSGNTDETENLNLTRKQTADYLRISVDSLRNWELNGLLSVKRKQNGYRIYTGEDIKTLKIIRSLRTANYSLSAVLRMLNRLKTDPNADILEIINTPEIDEDIISVCDKLLVSLAQAEVNAVEILVHLENMKNLK